jgi:Fur family transcriptional regulator, ferric uptake regulator
MKTDSQFQKNDTGAPVSDRLLAAMLDAGYSNTRPRQAVVDVIATANGYLSPVQILETAQRAYPQLGLVTVYRTLDIMAEMGLVRKVHLANGCHSYALAEKMHGHHIICESCRQVVEFDGCDLSSVIISVERQTGFAVTDHWLELFGLCPACRSK